MRIFKFRHWCPQEREMTPFEAIKLLPSDNMLWHVFEEDWLGGVLLEWTGLYDKNGTEIYEGDILDFDPFEWNRSSWTPKSEWEYPKWVVEWNDKEGRWDTGGGTTSECSVYKTVIGNIYQNHEIVLSA